MSGDEITPAPAIEVVDLTKTFGPTTALDGLCLTVATGQVHGFLGPNGAGKSTTIRVLLGLLRADSGASRVLGMDPWQDAPALHRRLAYVPGDVSLWPGLSGGEAIDLLGRARGGLDPRRKADLLERFELDPRKRCRTYSKGNRQKVALVAALASDVELLLLDEPTSGLDPLTVVDHPEMLDHGNLSVMPGVHDPVVEGDRLTCQVDDHALSDLLARLGPLGVRALTSTPPTLEELFLRHYEGAER